MSQIYATTDETESLATIDRARPAFLPSRSRYAAGLRV
jgi:hypothetical protein